MAGKPNDWSSITGGSVDLIAMILIGGGYVGGALAVLDPGAWSYKIPALVGMFVSTTMTLMGMARWYSMGQIQSRQNVQPPKQ